MSQYSRDQSIEAVDGGPVRYYAAPDGSTVRVMAGHTSDPSLNPLHVHHNDAFVAAFPTLDRVIEYLASEYAIIPDGSVWQHPCTGRQFTVLCAHANAEPEGSEFAPPAETEPFACVRVDEYDQFEHIWYAHRTWDQLTLVTEVSADTAPPAPSV
jgi:hypothetical protein